MRHNIVFRIFFGLSIILIGTIVLLQNLKVIQFQYWPELWGGLWALLLVVAGVTAMAGRRKIWGALLLVASVAIALWNFHVVDVDLWDVFWPVLLVAGGIAVLFPSLRRGRPRRSGAAESVTTVFSGDNQRVSGDYAGSAITAVFGGAELDLRRAQIKDGAVIEVFALFGGVNIIVPSDVVVENQITSLLGGVDNKTSPVAAEKTLYLRGQCMLGGVDVK